MILDTLSNGLKDLFSTLGAKTTDSNYAVGLYNKTSGEPQGLMDMSSLASVLGVEKALLGQSQWSSDNTTRSGISSATWSTAGSKTGVPQDVAYGVITEFNPAPSRFLAIVGGSDSNNLSTKVVYVGFGESRNAYTWKKL